MSIDGKGHERRHRRSRKLQQIRTGGMPPHPLQVPLFIGAGNARNRPLRLTTAEREAERARSAEQRAEQRAEQLEAMKRAQPALVPCLEVAVPMWIERLSRKPIVVIEARANELAEAVAFESDAFERSSKPGHAARAFNAIAEGLAALSFGPGGVTWLGLHFEAVHPGSEREARP